jgi:HK97 family phage major capsid protein
MPDNTQTPEQRVEAMLTEQGKKHTDALAAARLENETLKVRVEALEKRTAPAVVVNEKPKFSFVSAIRGISTGRWEGAEALRDESEKTRAMSVASDANGGYVVPFTYVPEVIDLLTETPRLHSWGTTVIRGARGKSYTRTRKTAGTSAAYLAENTSLGLTAPTFDQVTITPHLAGAYSSMSRLLADNSDPSAEQIVRNDLSRAAGLLQDQTGLFGDGSGSTPTGLFNADGVNLTSVGAAITLDRILNAITAIEGRNGVVNEGKVGIGMHSALWGTLRKTKGSTNDHYILSNDMSSPTKRSIQGWPVYVSNLLQIETGGTDSAYACVVGDFSQLEHIIWNDVGLEATNVGGDAFVKHQLLVKITWADEWFVTQPDSFECFTDLYAA